MASKRSTSTYPHLNHLLEAMASSAGVKVTPVSRRAYPENAGLLEDQAGRLLQQELAALASDDAAAWGAIAKERSCPDLVGWVTQAHGALGAARAAKAQAGKDSKPAVAKTNKVPVQPEAAAEAKRLTDEARAAKAAGNGKTAKAPAGSPATPASNGGPAGSSAKLDAAIEAVLAAMPGHNYRMNKSEIKAVLGWPAGYHNITKLCRTLEERGLATPAKRDEDKLMHWEAKGDQAPPAKAKAAKAPKAKAAKAPKAKAAKAPKAKCS